MTGGLLAVHAHPDDETLATGALLATWAASGAPPRLVTCTRGEQGEVIGPSLAHLEGSGAALAAHREQELAAALLALGVREHHFLDQLPLPAGLTSAPETSGGRFEDSGMAWLPGQSSGTAAAAQTVPDGAFVSVPLDEAAGRLAAYLDQVQPDVVVTYDPGGGYGHPDHVRTHEVTMRALELARRAEPVVLWASTTPEVLRAQRRQLAQAPWARNVAREHDLSFPDPAADLPSIADATRPTAVSVRMGPVLTHVIAALRVHATQVHAISAAPADSEPSPEGLLGCYALSNDVLAGIGATETYSWGSTMSRGRAQHLNWPPGITIEPGTVNECP